MNCGELRISKKDMMPLHRGHVMGFRVSRMGVLLE